ncbi:hypothetical protein Leryth_002736, partial [Lithospermum erythrorhizon]
NQPPLFTPFPTPTPTMLRSLLRSAASHSRTFATSKQTKGSLTKAKRSKPKSDESSASSSAAAEASDQVDDTLRAKLLADEAGNRALDVGPNGRPLSEELNKMLPEGLPMGMVKEFEESLRNGLLVRQGFLDLRDNFRRIVDPPMYSDGKGLKLRQQVVLDGPANCGKSIALAMLVFWARNEGWLVLYSPRGREWTHGGFFYKNRQTGLWDTPVQAANILQDFLKYNETVLQKLPCHVFDPIPLGEGAGVALRKDIASISVPENSSLYDLIQIGISNTHAAVGVLVHLRKELSHVKDVPVLIAIDQYNSWFTFSEYGEANTVNAFRSMVDKDMMMVGAFSHTISVGKLRQELPGVPSDARVILPRYSLDEAATVSHYYRRQRLVSRESFSEDGWKKIYYLANGNGAEMRWLVPFMR